MHWARRAASRAAWTAGSSRAIRTAMMAMTTSISISVKPRALSRFISVSNPGRNQFAPYEQGRYREPRKPQHVDEKQNAPIGLRTTRLAAGEDSPLDGENLAAPREKWRSSEGWTCDVGGN